MPASKYVTSAGDCGFLYRTIPYVMFFKKGKSMESDWINDEYVSKNLKNDQMGQSFCLNSVKFGTLPNCLW